MCMNIFSPVLTGGGGGIQIHTRRNKTINDKQTTQAHKRPKNTKKRLYMT